MAASDLNLLASLAHMLGQEVDSRLSSDSSASRSSSGPKVTYYSATCLDQQCQNKLFFPQHEASVVCPDCGQRHSVADLMDRTILADEDRFGVEASQLRKKHSGSKKNAEQIKVNGVSNFQCKLLSPLLSTYGMDKDDRACKLKDLKMGNVFDCSKLANRVFSIEEIHLHVLGYGLDRSGSQLYLKDILSDLREVNGGVENLVPLHADGDGHCLVHAISRCLVGRELFWHALRSNLHSHLSSYRERYTELFKDFYSPEEWEGLIAEAAPDWKPPDGQSLGLSNIHIYGLANVLRRPIILLDSLDGMKSSGDYSGIFLPNMFTPQECSYGDGGVTKLNPPLVIAWSSSGRNHFIPLIHVKGKPLPRLPVDLQPKVWGVDAALLLQYMSMGEDGTIEVCGGKELGKNYLLRLIKCMDQLFLDKHRVSPALVGDVDLYVFKQTGCVGVATETTIFTTSSAVEEGRLFRCLICSAISIVPLDWLRPHGLLHNKAAREDKLQDNNTLSFPFDGITARYDAAADKLVPVSVDCFCCSNMARKVLGNGAVIYENGDRTLTPAVKSRCGCGYKHFWDGKEYDNLPEKIPLSLNWNGKVEPALVHWFQYESDPELNSNVFQVAYKVVSDKFPGEFGSERLVQQVVDQILKVTASQTPMEQVTGHHPAAVETTPTSSNTKITPEVLMPATKTILTGAKSRTLHKEELGTSEAEKSLRRRIQENAKQSQSQSKKRTKYSPTSHDAALSRKTTPPPKKVTPPPKSVGVAKPLTNVKRVRVTTSDGRTCSLTLNINVTYAELLDAIQKELGIPSFQQKLRSGFPPRELLPPSDPSLPVDLPNGEKVSVDIVSRPPTDTPPQTGNDASELAVMQENSEETNFEQKKEEILQNLLQLIDKEMDYWLVAQHQPQHFCKDGDFYQQVMRQYGDRLQHNAHMQFQELPGKTFAYNAEKECLELCLGLKHIPIRPLTREEELAVAAAARDDLPNPQTAPTPISSAVTSGGSIIRANSLNQQQHVKAFSGKGHTLSSTSPTVTGSAFGKGYTLGSTPVTSAATTNSTFSRTTPHKSGVALENSANRVEADFSGRGRGGASEPGSSLSAVDGHVGAEFELAQRLIQAGGHQRLEGQELEGGLTEGGKDSSDGKMRLLQDQELSLQNLVSILKNKLVEIGLNRSTDRPEVLVSLLDQLQKAQSNLDKVQQEIKNSSTS